MDHGLISTINLIIEILKFLPQNILIIVKKKISCCPIDFLVVIKSYDS
jgi:hypothetical protein